jgi:multiple sugar transport system permease protein
MTAATTSGNRPRPGLLGDRRIQEWLAGYGFITPAMLIIVLFIFIPMIFSFVISFTDWTGLQPPNEAQGIGFENYQDLLLRDNAVRDDFFKALKNTTYYALGVVPVQTIFSLLLAVVVNQKFLKGRGFFRTVFYFPSITSSVAIGMIFLWIFNRNGLVNLGIGAVSKLWGGGYRSVTWLNDANGLFTNFYGLFGLKLATAPEWMKTVVLGQSIWQWISGPSISMCAIMAIAIWTTSGTLMLIYLSALQDIPTQLYEAAAVDGATLWQQFRFITIPALRATTFFVVTIGLIGSFQVFDQIYVISQGQPAGTTSTIAWIVYRNAFKDSFAGRGAATAFTLFVIIMVITLIQRRIMDRRNT